MVTHIHLICVEVDIQLKHLYWKTTISGAVGASNHCVSYELARASTCLFATLLDFIALKPPLLPAIIKRNRSVSIYSLFLSPNLFISVTTGSARLNLNVSSACCVKPRLVQPSAGQYGVSKSAIFLLIRIGCGKIQFVVTSHMARWRTGQTRPSYTEDATTVAMDTLMGVGRRCALNASEC